MQGEFCKFRKNFQLQICLAVTCVLCALKKRRQATCLLTFRVVPHVLVQSIALPCFFKKTATHQTCMHFFVSALQYRPELQQVAKVQSKAKTNCNNFFAVRVLPCLRKALPCRAFSKKPQHIKPVLRFFDSALQYRPELQQVAKVQSKAKTNCNNFFAVRVDMPCKQ